MSDRFVQTCPKCKRQFCPQEGGPECDCFAENYHEVMDILQEREEVEPMNDSD